MKGTGTGHIEELLPRYCEGTATEDERRQVEEWMSASDENFRMVKQIYALYLAADTAHVMQTVDTEKALHRAKRRINRPQRMSLWQGVQRVAAILALPLLLSTLWLYINGNKKEEVQMLEARTNPGMTTQLTLADGTKVFLNSESSIAYPSRFDGDTRSVSLQGEAYFEVAKNPKQKFIVSTPHNSQIEVLGTHFNVEAYAHEAEVYTTLLEGEVGFEFLKGDQREKVLMQPGQKLIYDSKTQSVQLLTSSGEGETAWTQGKIIFRNTPLEEGLRMLEKRYNVDFEIRNDKLKDYSFTGTFTNQRLERILEYFRLSSHIRWRYVDLPDISNQRNKIEIY